MLAALLAAMVALGAGATLGVMAAPRTPPQPISGNVLRVMTFNLRYDEPADGANRWEHRRDFVAGVIRFHQADIVGVQEASAAMLNDLMRRLPGWHWAGEAGSGGVINAILWRGGRADLVQSRQVWLSPRPGKPGWDAMFARTAVIAQMRDAQGRAFTLVNTHWDHKGAQARQESAHMMAALLAGMPGPVIVLGDFNCEPDSDPMLALQTQGRLENAARASAWGHFGSKQTFTGFEPAMRGSENVDHILVRGCAVQQHGTLCDHADGRLPSDHFPVLAEILLP
jgi:endonuclease/exonuclease/phosphatase family metal-dependent hydrolase